LGTHEEASNVYTLEAFYFDPAPSGILI